MESRKDEIKKALLGGGLVVAPRGQGKTSALVEILIEDKNAVLIVAYASEKIRIRQALLESGLTEYGVSEKLFLASSTDLPFHRINYLHDKNVYVDEWFSNTYKGPFKAAVTSEPFTVTIVEH